MVKKRIMKIFLMEYLPTIQIKNKAERELKNEVNFLKSNNLYHFPGYCSFLDENEMFYRF